MASKVVGFPRRTSTGSIAPTGKRKPIRIAPSKKGSLHAALGVPQGSKIPPGKIDAALANASGNLRKKLQFAKNAKSFNH